MRLFSIILSLLPLLAFSSAEDSAVTKKLSTKNDTWYIASEPDRRYVIDTTLYNVEEYNRVQRGGNEYLHTGNTGGAAFPLIFENNKAVGFNAGYNQYDIYRFHRDSIKYYQVVRPYAELGMVLGLKNEQIFHGRFAHQINKVFYYGVDFTRVFSRGTYLNQRTNDNGFSLYGLYNSKNHRWGFDANFILNNSKVQENGGVLFNPFDSSFFQKKLVPVALLTAENVFRQIDFQFKTFFNVGKKYSERRDDTTVVQTLLPVFKISHRLNIEHQMFRFLDPQRPDASPVAPEYYGDFYTADTIRNLLSYYRIGNAVGFDLMPRKLTSDSTYIEKDFIAHAEAGFDYYLTHHNFDNDKFGNLYVSGYIRNNFSSRSHLIYKGGATYFLYGWNGNDLLIDALAGYDFQKFGAFTGNFSYQLKEAPFIYERFDYLPKSWAYSLPKTKIMNAGGKYHNAKYGVTADVNYYVADHLPVYPGFESPYVTTAVENIFVFHAANRHSIVSLHFDNDVWYTYGATTGYVRRAYPRLVTRSSIYYENTLFKKALRFSIGFDVRYRLSNNAPYYDPFLGAFYPSFTTTRSFPVADFFLNLKIKTVRVFLKLDNLSSVLGGKGYYNAYLYPAADFSFKAGIRWRFYE